VVSGATEWLTGHDARELTTVAIAPDLGERYLDTVYQPGWVEEFFAAPALGSKELTGKPASRSRAA
jgi:hypothetical protein